MNINNMKVIPNKNVNDGRYLVVYFYDNKYNPINEENASIACGIEHDKEGRVIRTIYYNLKGSEKSNNLYIDDKAGGPII